VTALKASSRTTVAVVDQLIPFLVEWMERSQREYPKCEWLFNIDGNRIDADRLATAWEQCRVVCGIPQGVMMYDARRTHRGLLDDNDVLKDDAKDQMGQVTDAMSDLYKNSFAHVNRIRAAFSKKKGPQTASVPSVNAPATPVLDWKAALAELKEQNDRARWLTPSTMPKLPRSWRHGRMAVRDILAQLVEHRIRNARVRGSTPRDGSIFTHTKIPQEQSPTKDC